MNKKKNNKLATSFMRKEMIEFMGKISYSLTAIARVRFSMWDTIEKPSN